MIYIWVRATTNWHDEAEFRAQLPEGLHGKVAVWNETFDMPFHLFRHRVREIARRNLARVDGAACAAWDDIPDGAVVMPVDDDDWFAPHAARVLEAERAPGVLGYYWLRSFLEVPMSFWHGLHLVARHTVGREMPFLAITNSYALVKRAEHHPLLASHVQASRWFEAAPPGTTKKIEQWLSTMNRTLASQTQLGWERPAVRRPELIWKLRAYRWLYRRPPPPELAWSAPYRAMMRELIDELRVKQ